MASPWSCSRGCATEAQSSRQPAPSDVVATIGSSKVTLADVDERALAQSAGNFGSLTLAQALYESRRAVLDEIVGNQLIDQEAKARGVERAALIKNEIEAKVTDRRPRSTSPPGTRRIRHAFRALRSSRSRRPIRSLLTQERTLAARREYIDGLKAKTSVTVALDPPRIKVADARTSGARPRGRARFRSSNSRTFECPYCLRAHPTVAQVLSTYGDQIRLVYRALPAAKPSQRPARGGSVGLRERTGKVLAVPRSALRESDPAHATPTSSSMRRRSGSTPRSSMPVSTRTSSRATSRTIMEAGEAAGVNGHAGVLHQRTRAERRPAVRSVQARDRRRARTEVGRPPCRARSTCDPCTGTLMRTDQLSTQLDRLALFDAGPFPVVSLYLDMRPNHRGRDHFDPFLRKELAERLATFEAGGTGAPEPGTGRREDPVLPRRHRSFGERAGAVRLLGGRALRGDAARGAHPAHRLYISERPHLYPLARLIDEYPRAAFLLANTNSARLFVVAANAIQRVERVESVKTKRHKMGGWSQARYQRHTRTSTSIMPRMSWTC